jgi:hypothetical protein
MRGGQRAAEMEIMQAETVYFGQPKNKSENGNGTP